MVQDEEAEYEGLASCPQESLLARGVWAEIMLV